MERSMFKEVDEEEPDVGFCFVTDPPLIVPLSQRAKDKLDLPKGADCALFLDDPSTVVDLFGPGYVFTSLTEYEPTLIVPCSIDTIQLH